MPIYQYMCPECEETVELIQKMGDQAPVCDVCNILMVKVFPNRSGFVLNGSGWYKDGYSGDCGGGG